MKKILDNETYVVWDDDTLDHLTTSKTMLHPNKETTGHSHLTQDEVYIFMKGYGEMIVGTEKREVRAGDVVNIPAGNFHQVINNYPGKIHLEFYSIFNGRRV